ncbi:MAG TPA: ATP-binding protein [Desulfatirhabdiaceae bacterium]|nr:ATP-binding protein [Desulfatirhabdiaceae bacterium]
MNPFKNKAWMGIPPWIFIGAVVVLFPIFAFMTAENINRQKKQSINMLQEKGAALIRSFEAGTRTGMMDRWSGFQLQKLLMETSQQPDIVHLIVTDLAGSVLASSDPEQIGRQYGTDLNLQQVALSGEMKWRNVTDSNRGSAFEIYKRFTPAQSIPKVLNRRRMKDKPYLPILPVPDSPPDPPRIIFIGLDTTSIDQSIQLDMRHTVIMGTILLLVGFAGVMLLFLAMSYRAAQTSLSRIKAFSDTLVDNMPMGLAALDMELRIVSINPVALQLLNISDTNPVGKNASDLIPKELLAPVMHLDIHHGPMIQTIECSISGGEPIPLEINAAKLIDEDQSLLGYVILLRDLREVASLRKALARSQRLASLGSLSAGIAHEIRNPLSSIKGFATYFQERYADVPEDAQTALVLIQEVDRLNRVVTQLLEFAKPVTLSMQPVLPGLLIAQTIALLKNQAIQKNIEFQIQESRNIPPVLIDMDRMNQVLLNLFLNAFEAMPNGGILNVAIETDETGAVCFIRIMDTGCGIHPVNLTQIFNPYFTTKSSGTGLGLAIAHNIIEAHQGDIRVESEPGQGTVVTIRLPAVIN